MVCRWMSFDPDLQPITLGAAESHFLDGHVYTSKSDTSIHSPFDDAAQN